MAFASPNLFPRLTPNIWRKHYLVSFFNLHSFPKAFFLQPLRISFIFLSTIYHIGFFFWIKGFFHWILYQGPSERDLTSASPDLLNLGNLNFPDSLQSSTFNFLRYLGFKVLKYFWLSFFSKSWCHLGILQGGIFKKDLAFASPNPFPKLILNFKIDTYSISSFQLHSFSRAFSLNLSE